VIDEGNREALRIECSISIQLARMVRVVNANHYAQLCIVIHCSRAGSAEDSA
jgi:hypothetical protein